MDIFTVSSNDRLNASENQKFTPGFLKADKNSSVKNTGSSEDKEDSAEISEEGRKKAEENSNELSDAEKKDVEKLQRVDKQVKAHESAHLAAAGGIAVSGASFQYTKGPDGKMYAVGGEVSIDTSKEDTPEATISKAQRIRSAALAPSDPSPQDHRVAAQASQMEAAARAEVAAESINESGSTGENSENKPGEAEEAKGNEKGFASGELVDITA